MSDAPWTDPELADEPWHDSAESWRGDQHLKDWQERHPPDKENQG